MNSSNFTFELWASLTIAVISLVVVIVMMVLYLVVKFNLESIPWLKVDRPKK